MKEKKLHFQLCFFCFWCLLAPFLFLTCSAPSSREHIDAVRESAKHQPAADYMDSFWLDYRSPQDREVKHWEFYYKNCSLISRKPWPDRAEYECMAPY